MIRPRTFAIAAAVRRALQLPVMYVQTTMPRGSDYSLDYVLVSFPRTVVAGAQTSPELLFRLLQTRGIAHNNNPIPFTDVTNPGGFSRLRKVLPLGIVLPPGAIVTMEVTGMAAGPVPATISITYLGRKGWEGR